ncbi:hydroxyacylglutathione hydrolase [Trichosporon asahii var. asahii CBS 8904]|uniref:Hydroxyacylglutathione hydrolase n=1 Tax=Trichosporon asahii var. asahii (strain CBS 8904) TaxID=1220162 RepID=K1VNE9_TRIAC|nr:hydroxyacylglutathione hydrolase [Trichosporon asahii var. asahii CBS 8904]
MKVIPVQARSDNWMYLGETAVVDPYDAPKIDQAAKDHGANVSCAVTPEADVSQVTRLITTHHHFDHSGGNEAFLHPGIKVYAGSDKAPGANEIVKDGDEFDIGDIHVKTRSAFMSRTRRPASVVSSPETRSSSPAVAASSREMHDALTKLGKLPEDTLVFNGHEYTMGSAKFGHHIEPHNEAIKRLMENAQASDCTTGKSTIGDEKQWNVFMRLDTPEAQWDPVKVMQGLRDLKNEF